MSRLQLVLTHAARQTIAERTIKYKTLNLDNVVLAAWLADLPVVQKFTALRYGYSGRRLGQRVSCDTIERSFANTTQAGYPWRQPSRRA